MDPNLVFRFVFVIVLVGIVVGGVGGLGYALGRYVARRRGSHPTLPDDHERRLRILEVELDVTQSEVTQLREEREFLRRLNRDEDRGLPTPHRDAA